MTLMMKNDKIKDFNRKCIASGLIELQSKMLRFDYNKGEQIIQLDLSRKLKGRGAYFIPTEKNWEIIVKKKCLNKTFRTAVSKETYNNIEKILKEEKWLRKTE
ncbi:DUF448 domain-containing protein [Mycoplasma sp. CH-Wi4]|uniref:DUF448 domain-containing protein n=2 Tax=Mycoplasma tauri TaxID=547987 RepID=A0A953NDZ4_9MOLU|nr:YlxR family protein [Mycoplasma tauri]MBZ4195187.1 DUF448 domain-containing protein [Mycoplasma tauri]MBZ4203350.1 DUF448 domain-containing protein [Mycoplasma tauri]MBZ4204207.1 DUF448 domain-containing protein [Mycoplasma tauri]MBZ4212732.1 DUF448 domain-containing protein [Mycoplasma tauri]MBZ4226568.1 DUF448 domain-containing protein [Mycoplasma tauri]